MIIPLNIPDNQKDLVIAALCSNQGYQAFTDAAQTVPNPETNAQFAKRMIIQIGIRDQVKLYQKKLADQAATITDLNIT
jgi:hypothetical protein